MGKGALLPPTFLPLLLLTFTLAVKLDSLCGVCSLSMKCAELSACKYICSRVQLPAGASLSTGEFSSVDFFVLFECVCVQ